MATLEQHPTSKHFLIRFRFAGRSFKRSLKTENKKDAQSALSRLHETISMVQRGFLIMPSDADPATYFLSGGKATKSSKNEKGITLGELFTKYQSALPVQAKEKTTLKTEATHLKHFRRKLPLSKALNQVTTHDIQQFINSESKRKFGKRSIGPDTIIREIVTLKCIFNWAQKQELVDIAPQLRGLVYGKRDEKPPFMTRTEIERIINRGGLSEIEIDQLWDAMYLTIPEVHEVLELVKERARYPFIYPMLAFVAYTGARRSEMIRVMIDDFDLEIGTVLIRERKRSRLRSTTFRRVELPSKLVGIIKDWLSQHPGGQSAFVQNFDPNSTEIPKALTADQARSQFNKALHGTKWSVVRGYHVFRHSYASNLATKGVDQRIIDKHMGHQTEEMRKRYQHLMPEVCRRAVESLVL